MDSLHDITAPLPYFNLDSNLLETFSTPPLSSASSASVNASPAVNVTPSVNVSSSVTQQHQQQQQQGAFTTPLQFAQFATAPLALQHTLANPHFTANMNHFNTSQSNHMYQLQNTE